LKQFYAYFSRFLKEDFHIFYYTSVAIFLSLAIWINYYIDLEDSILDKLPGTFLRYLAFTGLYMVAYGIVLILNRLIYPENEFLNNKWLWLKVFVGFSVLSFDTALHTFSFFTYLPVELYYYLPKVFNYLFSFISYLLPLGLFYWTFDRNTNFYGLTLKGFRIKPYVELFALVIPLVALASFYENFNSYYPIYQPNGAAEYYNLPEWVSAGVYELAYGWSFISVEFMFRGFFVVGLVKILGRHAILPMVVTYCFIHFGKPVGECISSIFGGYILGIIAYYSRNIFGGIAIHIGLAWVMEIIASLHN